MGGDTLLDRDVRAYSCYVGMETDLIFNQGVDLPGFASFPLLESADGRARLIGYAKAQLDWSRAVGMGAILEAPTWMANPDRAAPLGYAPDQMAEITRAAVKLLKGVDPQGVPCLVSANIGPRDDAYAPGDQMDQSAAEIYHRPQIDAAVSAGADMVSGFTLAYAAEAVGIARAARAAGIRAVIAFTVELDGKLPSGERLADAIAKVDAACDGSVEYYMINCAHPDHFSSTLQDPTVASRVAGLIVNASRCSHAELDEAEELDDGDPAELGELVGALAAKYPGLRVFGGCCGTDARHMTAILAQVSKRHM